MKTETITGPKINPSGPKNDKPPNTEKSIMSGWTFVFALNKYGPKKLSIVPTKSIPQIESPIAKG